MGLRAAALLLALASPAVAQDRAGDFDYYLLALSWSPSWCAAEGDARGAEQCDPDRDAGFLLHGLWPQYERGWPEFCTSKARDPSRRETAAMADLMGSGGQAWYQWRKHGRCSGEAPEDYFAAARLAVSLLALPEPQPGRTTPADIEDAFRRLNPAFGPDAVAVTCRDGRVAEIRLCLTRDLGPRDCGADVLAGACRADRAIAVPPVR
jgi:ribonuclease T2